MGTIVAHFGRMAKYLQLSRVHGVVLATAVTVSCAGLAAPKTTVDDPSKTNLAELWSEPSDLASRSFFDGPAGRALAPAESTRYELIAVDSKGYSGGYDVRDRQGVKWSVKIGKEAQPEVTVSRVLSGLGFHQPPVYLVHDWQLDGATGVDAASLRMARFRREDETAQVVGDWSWYENPFVGTQPFQGLVVVNLMLNNWDWKTSNNKIYDLRDAQGGTTRVYVVRDLGASLGKTSFPAFLKWTPMRGMGQGSRNDVDGFEQQGFIKEIDGQQVKFHYNGIHRKLVDTITVTDVVWTARLMSRVSEEQWRDAFRAGGFTPAQQQRYVTKLQSKIREALAGPA
jgi:hypothetical protein